MVIKILFSISLFWFSIFAFGFPINADKYLADIRKYYTVKDYSSCVPHEMSSYVPQKIISRFLKMNVKSMDSNNKNIESLGYVDKYEQIRIIMKDDIGEIAILVHVKDSECKFFELDEVFDHR